MDHRIMACWLPKSNHATKSLSLYFRILWRSSVVSFAFSSRHTNLAMPWLFQTAFLVSPYHLSKSVPIFVDSICFKFIPRFWFWERSTQFNTLKPTLLMHTQRQGSRYFFHVFPNVRRHASLRLIFHLLLSDFRKLKPFSWQGEKLLFVLNELELCDEDFLVYVTEFLVSNSISHLFNEEEHTSITNAIRTEVTQAGLSYTKETAWNFFLK